ncbi:MAG: PadR family transcriptional regulator [Lachnospiraceae bacterium]|nr:PadR family transcriptional regulator [Lachnospiraceae bacterium]
MYIDVFKRGTLEMIILLILCEADAYGYQIAQALRIRSHGILTIQDGALYPLLYRLTENHYVTNREEIIKTSTGRSKIRVIYTITENGRQHLKHMKKDYDQVQTTINDFFLNSEVNIDEL